MSRSITFRLGLIGMLATALAWLPSAFADTASSAQSAWTRSPLKADPNLVDPLVKRGKEVFEARCQVCHGAYSKNPSEGSSIYASPAMPGTVALELRYKGLKPALLEERRDLTPELVALFVRRGGGGAMPAFRPTEVSSDDLEALGAYLSRDQSSSASHAATGMACEKLPQLKLADTLITKAEMITPAPAWQIPDSVFTRLAGPLKITVGVPFCRVSAVIEKEINVEVWLPTDWNERFQGVGNAGLTGALNHPAMAGAVNAHFATASTDTGHVTDRDVFQSDWIEGHPQRVIDFGYRAHHLMAERSKEIIAAFYGKPAAHNYYSGCSSGGWQGLTEAQRYPADYDGIVAGAPAINYLGATTRGMVLAQAAAKEPEGNLDGAASQLLVQAATARCDTMDGLKDGLIGDPVNCKFDPAELECREGKTKGCLNAAQVRRAGLTYGPLKSPGGLKLYPGPTWGTAAFFALPPAASTGSAPAARPAEDPLTAMTRALTGKAPPWTPATFDPDKHMRQLVRDLGPTLNSLDPDLKSFKDGGGKLILYHGGADPGLSPYNTLDYVASVEGELGKPAVDTFVRTYLVPGMGHCFGGTGPSVFDAMTPLIAWVERGERPKEIVAVQPGPNGKVVRSRPLCPFPRVARYKGSGPAEAASSFECR